MADHRAATTPLIRHKTRIVTMDIEIPLSEELAKRIRDSLIARALSEADPCDRDQFVRCRSTEHLASLLSLGGVRQLVEFTEQDGRLCEADFSITHVRQNVLYGQYHSFRILDPENTIGFAPDNKVLLGVSKFLHILGARIAERLNLRLEIS